MQHIKGGQRNVSKCKMWFHNMRPGFKKKTDLTLTALYI